MAAWIELIMFSAIGLGFSFATLLLDYGPHIDGLNPKTDDGCGAQITLNSPFNFYGAQYSSFWVCNNGFISFSGAKSTYIPDPFPIEDIAMIAAFWQDLDNRPGSSSDYYNKIYWRVDSSMATRRDLSAKTTTYLSDRNFFPSWVIVATWYRVGYFSQNIDMLNTFQIALACEKYRYCYAFLSYDQLQWTKRDRDEVHAQAGFNDGKTQSTMLPGSRTSNIRNLVYYSNVGKPGLFIYRLTNNQIENMECDPKIVPEVAQMYFESEQYRIEGFLCDRDVPQNTEQIKVLFVSSTQKLTTKAKLDNDQKTIIGSFPFWGKAEIVTVHVFVGDIEIKEVKPIVHPDPILMVPEKRSCESLIAEEKFHEQQTETDWHNFLSSLTGCPRNSVGARGGRNDAWFAHAEVRTGRWTYDPCCSGPNGFKSEAFHFCADCKMNNGAEFCIISRAINFDQFADQNSVGFASRRREIVSNQCCYSANGNLLTNPFGGAGTAKRSIPNNANLFTFFNLEYSFFKSCCINENSCKRYFEHRPSTAGSYTPRRSAINWGDPHIETLDGFKYTFNGIGVFTLMEMAPSSNESRSNMTVHASMRQVGKGSVFSGLVIADLTTTAELFLTESGEIVISINGSKLDFDEKTRTVQTEGCLNIEEAPSVEQDSVFVTLQQSRGNEEFTFRLIDSDLVVSAIISPDKVLNVGVSPPTEAMGKLQGLLGDFDGNNTNELTLSDGSLMPLTSNMTDIHHTFGNKWKVGRDQWIFAAASQGELENDVAYESSYTPVYEASFDNPDLERQAKKQCGSDENCLLDVALTGNIKMANNSKQMEKVLRDNDEMFEVQILTTITEQTEQVCDSGCVSDLAKFSSLILGALFMSVVVATGVFVVRKMTSKGARTVSTNATIAINDENNFDHLDAILQL
ncbi:protein mesh-like isoform X2 [Convolutriloba macropyga]